MSETAQNKPCIAVVFGGKSGEHEVSLESATSVLRALNKDKYTILPLLIAKDGKWYVGESDVSIETIAKNERRLSADAKNYLSHLDGSIAERIDVLFPLVHGTGGEDGALQGLFELIGVPYVGSGILGSSVGMDKVAQKHILKSAGISVVPWVSFSNHTWKVREKQLVATIEEELTYPVFVKPANLGSSVGITKAHNRIELIEGITLALSFDTKALVEWAVPKAREIECAGLGNHEVEISECGEIFPSNEFYDYAAKYIDGETKTAIPAKISVDTRKKIHALARHAYTVLSTEGMARIDFLISGETEDIYLNEVNTLPGFTGISMYPKLWEASGIPYTALLDRLIMLAFARNKERQELQRDFSAHVDKLKQL